MGNHNDLVENNDRSLGNFGQSFLSFLQLYRRPTLRRASLLLFTFILFYV